MAEWWVIRRLTFWGRWAKGGLPSLPTMSSIERARMGRGGRPSDEMPEDIAEVDHAVCIAPAPLKRALISYYAMRGTLEDKALNCGISRREFLRRKERGESFIHQQL